MRISGAIWLVASIGACGGPPPETYSATFTDRSIRIASYMKAFRNAEPALVEGLEGDSRMLARVVPKPASTETGGFGSGAWLNRQFVDPFLFTDREAALQSARGQLEQVSLPNDVALRAELFDPLAKVSDDPELRQLRLEQGALRRTLDAEDARVERERTLPKGAADLVRAIIVAWPVVPRPAQMHDVEAMVAWRLDNLEQALAPNSLSDAEREDLRDALAALSPLVARMPKVVANLAKLRKTLDGMWVTPYATEDEATLDKELAVYVGTPMPFDSLDGSFESAALSFEVQVDAGLSVLDAAARARVRARAKEILLNAPPCAPRVPVRGPLDMAPPDERAWACSLLHALDDAPSDLDELAADLALHDGIVVARWAVSTHGPIRAPEAALRRARLELDLTPAESSALLRLARARPHRALAVGIAATILTREGAAHARPRAHHWRGLGDAPMDLVDHYLTPSRRD